MGANYNQFHFYSKMDEQNSLSKNQVTVYLIVQYTPQRYISAAIFDDRRRLFEITSFGDNEHYTNLQALLIQTNPQQLEDNFFVYVHMKTDIKSQVTKVTQKFQNLNMKIDQPHGHLDVNLALSNLLAQDSVFYLKVMEDKKAMQALEKLLMVLKLDQDETNKKRFELQIFSFQKFMRLDQPVINALQIFPKDMEKKIISGTNTIFQILNKCKTHIGTRCLKRWMRQPLQSIGEISERLDKVAFFIKYPLIKNTIQNELKKLPDLDNLYYVFYKVQSGKKNNVQVNDLIKIYRTVHTMKQLLKGLTEKGSTHNEIFQIISQVEKNVKILNTICKMIEQNIIMQGRQNQYYVKPQAQKQLSVISKQQQKINKQIKEHINQVSKYLKTEIQKLPSNVYKWVLQADKKHTIQQVKQNPDYKFLTAKQSKITFTTQTLTSYCKDLINLEEEYKEKEKEILKKMYKVVAGYFPVMEQLSKILSELDALTTFATVINSNAGAETPWCRPDFKQSIKGTKLHHPCIRACVPNDCDISNCKTIILTGPNMGGKSTYIRTIGLVAYLAHIGCYVPAKQFETSVVDSIITRVGASDMQIKGISTFMSEMIESVTMLRSATNRSLVLIDELGRGTSTSQGFGIAWAICHELHTKIKPYCLFATHFHEMTKMADQLQGVANMYTSCKISNNQLQLQYKVLPGKMEKSYGIQVAKMLNFPKEIIRDAEAYLQFYETKSKQAVKLQENKAVVPMTNNEKQAVILYKEMKLKINENHTERERQQIQDEYRAKIKNLLTV